MLSISLVYKGIFTDEMLEGLTEAVGLLSVSVALTVVAVAGVTGAHHSTKMVSALLLTGGASAHVIVCRSKSHQCKQRKTKSVISHPSQCFNSKQATRESQVKYYYLLWN